MQELAEGTETGGSEHQMKDVRQLLAKAEQGIKTLREKVADQEAALRRLQVHAKHESSLATKREELIAGIADLRGDARELIRANRGLKRSVMKYRVFTTLHQDDRAGRVVYQPEPMRRSSRSAGRPG